MKSISGQPDIESFACYLGNLPLDLTDDAVIKILSIFGRVLGWQRASFPQAAYGFCDLSGVPATARALGILEGATVLGKQLAFKVDVAHAQRISAAVESNCTDEVRRSALDQIEVISTECASKG